MVRSTRSQLTLLALFAIASKHSSYVYADENNPQDVTVKSSDVDDVPAEAETPVVGNIQNSYENDTAEAEVPPVAETNMEEAVEEPASEVQEPVVADESDVEEPVVIEEEVVDEPVQEPVVVEKEQVEEPLVAEKEAAPVVEAEEEELIMDIDTVEMKEEIISKIKEVFKSSDLDAKKIAAFGLGAWGTVTGVGWAMEKIGGKKDE
jgi:hypothetical protein